MKYFTTPKGTTLPITDLRGKDYLMVAHRLVWFREEHPTWAIETEAVRLDEKVAIFKATIRKEDGMLVSQGTKTETPKGFPDYIEKAETGSIGRALAAAGYGTQFAPDLDEGDRIVDSPVDRPKTSPQIVTPQDVVNNINPSAKICTRCNSQMKLSKAGDSYYCPNYKDKSNGPHSYSKVSEEERTPPPNHWEAPRTEEDDLPF